MQRFGATIEQVTVPGAKTRISAPMNYTETEIETEAESQSETNHAAKRHERQKSHQHQEDKIDLPWENE
jgi:hypothetical protein